MFRTLFKTLPGALGVVLVVTSLALAEGNKHGMGGEIEHDDGIVSAIKDTGEAIIQTRRGLQYTVPANGLKVGAKVECITQDGDTVCQ